MAHWNSCLLAVAALACGSPSAPPDDATIVGPIYARNVVSPTSGTLPTIHVKTSGADPCGIIFAVNTGTELRRYRAGRVVGARLADFQVGRRVHAWADVVMESCPGQAFATAVLLIE